MFVHTHTHITFNIINYLNMVEVYLDNSGYAIVDAVLCDADWHGSEGAQTIEEEKE